jgi:hypothetical protein
VLEIDTRNWAVYVEIKGRPAPGKVVERKAKGGGI